jgi:chromosome transmission fidelity protein 1
LGEEEPEWVVEHEIGKKVKELEREEQELEERLREVRRREEESRRREMTGMGMGRRKRLVRWSWITSDRFQTETDSTWTPAQKLGEGKEGGARLVDDEDEFAPEPYFENEEDKNKVEENGVDNFSPAVREMMKKWVSLAFSALRQEGVDPSLWARRMNGGGSSIIKEEEEPDVSKVRPSTSTSSARPS